MDYSTIPLGLGIIFAFFGGLVSFISPCVLPLVPAYIGYMGGHVTSTVAAQVGAGGIQTVRVNRWSTFMNGVAFVAGFTFVFVIFGLLTILVMYSFTGANISIIKSIIGRVGGIMIIFLGLHFMGILPALFAQLRTRQGLLNHLLISIVIALIGAVLLLWGFSAPMPLWDGAQWDQARTYGTLWAPLIGVTLAIVWFLALFLGGAFYNPGIFWTKAMNTIEFGLYADTRRQMTATGQQSLLGSVMIGIIFAAGWTPCIGPIYGSILTTTASLTRSVAESAIWLAAYCLGLGVPFLLTALMLDSAQGILRRLQRHMLKIKLVTGVFLVLVGVLIATERLQLLSQQFAGQFGDFSVSVEGWAQRNLEQLFGMPSSADGESDLNLEDGVSAENSVRIDATPAANGEESPLELIVEDAVVQPIVGLEAGNSAPNFVADTDAGTPIALYDLRGQVVLVHFWSTVCVACPAQIEVYQALVSENPSFTVVAFGDGAQADTLANYREEWGLTFHLAFDLDGAIHDLYNVTQYPDNYLINREGLLIDRFSTLDVDQIRALIGGVLATP